MRKPRSIQPYGASALLLQWEQRIDADIVQSVHRYAAGLASLPGVDECIPAYASLLLTYRAKRTTYDRLFEAACAFQPIAGAVPPARHHELPVVYGGEYGPDLDYVSEQTGLRPQDVVALHCSVDYLVYFLGFRPGFAFLGPLPPALSVPRLPTPRPRVVAGSVGITGAQTGVYPSPSPGGWPLIGRCLSSLFTTDGTGARLQAGDRVRFTVAP